MNQYLTPLKDNNHLNKTPSKNLTQPREGDWVCYNCHNLNFSFRKKCNRCKVQTRQHNQQLSQYYYAYYPQDPYSHQQKQNFPSINPYSQSHSQKLDRPQTSQQVRRKFNGTPEKPSRLPEGLPSVSPLVKRYNRHESNSTQDSKRQGLFEDQGLWANINLTYLDEPERESVGSLAEMPEEIEEIERIIERIML